MESARKVVEKYYAAFDAHRDGWKDAEWARVRAGRLSEFRVYYDPRDFAKTFGIPA